MEIFFRVADILSNIHPVLLVCAQSSQRSIMEAFLVYNSDTSFAWEGDEATFTLTLLFCITSKYSNTLQLQKHVASPNDIIFSIGRLRSKHLDRAHALASDLFTVYSASLLLLGLDHVAFTPGANSE